ncbi:MAG: efflux RND transporter periplasmic adaptor subunit [Acidobacteriia bacterium]|nr:efflux RND transporter periplasmic adaptor subunit [Terriglobia bacterium]
MESGSEEQLRSEVERLTRLLDEHKRGLHATASHSGRPSGKTIFGLFVLCVAILAAAFALGYIPRQRRELQLVAEAGAQKESLPEVSVASAVRAPANGTLVLPGNIQAVTEAPILARAEGFVKTRYVDIGDRVATGQLLAEVEAPDLDQQVRQAQASVQQVQADLERASAALEQGKANESLAQVTASRWDNLARRGVVSRQENDQYQAQYQAQAANVRALDRAVAAGRASLSAAQANVARLTDMQGYLKVRAPFAGVVTQRNVDVGALVNNGSTLLFRIAQTNLLRTYLNVPQSSASDVRVGQAALLSTTELPDRKFRGTVTRTANALDPATRTLLAEVQVANPDGKLLPGMYVQVDLNLPSQDPPLLIPGDTLVLRPEGTMVAVLDANNVVHFQRIAVGRDLGSRIEVLSGLVEQQRVIVNPNDSVQEGVQVRPLSPGAARR